jgi:hypothetical protein
MRSYRKWYRAHTWPEEALSGRHMTFSLTFFPVFSRTFFFVLFFRIIFPYYFFSFFFPVFFSPILFFRTFFPVLFSPYFSKFATFEIQRFKISVSCFSSTCRYNTVHVPCGIAIQTSPVGLSLDGWGARMRDLKGPKMNLFNLKEDWNVL